MPAFDVTTHRDVFRVAVVGAIEGYEDVQRLLQAVRPGLFGRDIRSLAVDLSAVHDIGALGITALQVIHLSATVYDKRYSILVEDPLRRLLERKGLPLAP